MSASHNPSGMRDPGYYAKCMLGGVLACGVTHAAVTPLDVAKCRSQAHSKSGKWPAGLFEGWKRIAKVEGPKGFFTGVKPTGLGYGAQGMCKFGLNELFKDVYTNIVGREQIESAQWKKMLLWAAASGSAEVFADIALCPFEMVKVKMQVTLPGADTGKIGRCPTSLNAASSWMLKHSAETKYPFGSLTPLWGRQIPYTMIKFVGFYQTQDFVYNQLEKALGRQKADFSTTAQLGITFGCGYFAGVFCAIATQPMDNLVSMKGIPENQAKGWGQMATEMGTRDLFLKGLPTRIVMIGTLTGLQWWIYGSFKNAMGFGTS